MTNVREMREPHYNQLTWGPCHYFRSSVTGKRLTFRANEIQSVRPDFLSNGAIVESVGGCEFPVTSIRPESVR